MRVAVLDLGSTSFNLLIADADPAGDIQPLLRERAALNLGLIAAREGGIPGDVIDDALEVVRHFHTLTKRMGAVRTIVIATSALRDAADRLQLQREFAQAAGEHVRFLSGSEEALLMFAGVTAHRSGAGTAVLAMDLGGGSLELALGTSPRPDDVASLPIGAGRLAGSHPVSDPPAAEQRAAVTATIASALSSTELLGDAAGRSALLAIACGGSARALARMLALESGVAKPHVDEGAIDREHLGELADRLWSWGRDERLALSGLPAKRVDTLPCAALVLLEVMRRSRVDTLHVSAWGLREGCILEALGRAGTHPAIARLLA